MTIIGTPKTTLTARQWLNAHRNSACLHLVPVPVSAGEPADDAPAAMLDQEVAS